MEHLRILCVANRTLAAQFFASRRLMTNTADVRRIVLRLPAGRLRTQLIYSAAIASIRHASLARHNTNKSAHCAAWNALRRPVVCATPPIPASFSNGRTWYHVRTTKTCEPRSYWHRQPLFGPVKRVSDEPIVTKESRPASAGKEGGPTMASVEIITTPTADTPGTAIVLRTMNKAYVFGGLSEGTQRAVVQQGTRLLKAHDYFLTGRTEWKNTGGLIGMMLTLADSSASSYEQAIADYNKTGGRNRPQAPSKPQVNLYGPPNLKHFLGTCRRFIFRKGLPMVATEYTENSPTPNEEGDIPSTWQDDNLDVWALSIAPAHHTPDAQAEAAMEARRQLFDQTLNTFEDHQAVQNESPEDREARYDRIRSATVNYMFDSNWSFDTLVERHISEVEMPTAIFVKKSHGQGYAPYHGPRPGGPDKLPDIYVFTRSPWPGARILALPPTRPALECVSYVVRTRSSRGIFDVKRAQALRVNPGPDYGKLTRGESVQNKDGVWVTPDQVVGSDRPGQGVAILDVPSVDYLETIVQRPEFKSPQVMAGIEAFIWQLGTGVVGHPLLETFMKDFQGVKHLISSFDTSPDRIANDSAAGLATRLGLVDSVRFSTPVYDDKTVPQKSLYRLDPTKASPIPKGAMAADRGMSFLLKPKFVSKTELASALFDPVAASDAIPPEVIALAAEAQKSVQGDQQALKAWRNLLARPDTEITTLGTGSAAPSKYRNVSATLVRVPGIGNYLFDCGENTLGQLSRTFPHEELVDIMKNLRVIWISHLHADHHLGTVSVIRAWYELVHGGVPNSNQLPSSIANLDTNAYGLSVISHSGMLQFLHEYSAIEDFGYSRLLPLQISVNNGDYGSELSISDLVEKDQSMHGPREAIIEQQHYEKFFGFSDIQAVKVSHCFGAMACSITFPRSPADPVDVQPLKVSYSGDCRPSQAFGRIGYNSTVLIHEATFDDALQDDAQAKKHSTTSEAIGIGSQMNAKAVVLTHFSQRYQKTPILQTIMDGEQEEPTLDPTKAAEDSIEDEDAIDPTTENADNIDIYPTAVASNAKIDVTNQRVIKIRNKEMKVAIAADYMRVKIGEIAELEKFNLALNELFRDGDDDDVTNEDALINANGKKTSGDEEGGDKKKKKQKKPGKSQRNN